MSEHNYRIIDFDDSTEEFLVTFTSGNETKKMLVPASVNADNSINIEKTKAHINNRIIAEEKAPSKVIVDGARGLIGSEGVVDTDVILTVGDDSQESTESENAEEI